MLFLRSLLFAVSFWGWTLLLGLLGLPLLLFSKATAARYIPDLWVSGALWQLKMLCGITYRVVGTPKPGVVYAAKHQSAYETLAFWKVLRHPAFILKEQLLQIPVFGWYLRTVHPIAINRKAGASAIKQILRESKAALEAGRAIVIFPEGTRVAPGESKPFQPGVAALYTKLAPEVVPVALDSGKCWRRNRFIKQPGVITFLFLPSIAAGLDKETFLATLRQDIEAGCASLDDSAD